MSNNRRLNKCLIFTLAVSLVLFAFSFFLNPEEFGNVINDMFWYTLGVWYAIFFVAE